MTPTLAEQPEQRIDQCRDCEGDGNFICPSCRGNGSPGYDIYVCDRCGGSGVVECERCGGSGNERGAT